MALKIIALAFTAAFGLAQAAGGPSNAIRPAADGGRSNPDSAIGNTPETTLPAGTAANKKKEQKKKAVKDGKEKAGTTATPQQDSGNPASPLNR